jgi:hypothetical protein
MYERLDAERIITTLDTLEARIRERFPEAGLVKVCAELRTVAREATARVVAIEAPRPLLRAMVLAVALLGLALVALVAWLVSQLSTSNELFGTLQGIDAAFNILLLMGGAMLFLSTLEQRLKRRAALKDLHRLRSIVHVIDMHQLTKDPQTPWITAPPTASSPKRTLTAIELVRYLDYCSEMLSLAGKVAALYAQSSRDGVVIGAVNELEQLALGLSHKVWLKIGIVQAGVKAEAQGRTGASIMPKVAPAGSNNGGPLPS